jgi:hypothetical protein
MATPEERKAQIKRLKWPGLRKLWAEIQAGNAAGWDPGEAFEYLVLRAFELDKAEVRYPYDVILFDEKVEEIDGAVHLPGLSCLVESKDLGVDVTIGPIAKLRNQLQRRPMETMGILFSSRGFTTPAVVLAQFIVPQTILLWEGVELEFALQEERMCDFLMLKQRLCIEQGIPNYRILEGGGE